ncbi:Os06g0499400 [Oryza sativa Japonica Group]|uniref:Os06g0499400 protein n=1 Tax=Oryza sativa subsp. japonica TaxID=39947 RepID=A0A0P0WXD3_ORYSJ|nr:Os06g0499400 [Oryza sativa Japonica Group]
MAEGVVGSLIVKLGNTLASEAVELAKSLLGLEGSALKRLFSEIRDVKGELESIRAFLQAAERFKDADETTSAFVKQIRRLAFGIEDAVDEFTYQLGEGGGRMPFKRMCKIGTWSRLAANLQDIKVSLKSAAERRIRYDLKGVVVRGVKSVVGSSSNSNWRSDSVHFKRDDDLVGVDKNRDLLMRWVQDEQQQRHRIVSVWGMGGIGKTALVANVYNAVKDDFDTCAWITVSQSYDADDLLRTTVQEFRKNDRKKDFPDDEGASSYRRLVETIRSYLENKRYVLVLDDVWSTNVWFDSKDAFGGANIIGRIILTSRNYDVALLAPETNIINLQPLVKSHAWDLFCKEAFWKNGNRDCPPELLQLAQNFVDKCHGLPIAIADSSQEVLNLEALRPPPLLQKLYLKGTLSQESLPHFMSLHVTELDRDTFLNLERLPHLVKLQLYDAYDGKNIYFHENSFPRLRELSIRGAPHLNEIEMKRGAVASLTDLKLLVCPNLKQLPYGIEHVRTLEELTLDRAAEELVGRVRQKTETVISHVHRVYVGFSRNGVLAAERIQ